MASIPVDAAIRGGSVRVLSGSRIARRGNSGKSASSSFTFASWSFTTAAIDTSEPVPAVVGMQARGGSGSGPPGPASPRGAGAGGGGGRGARPPDPVRRARERVDPLVVVAAAAVGENDCRHLCGV